MEGSHEEASSKATAIKSEIAADVNYTTGSRNYKCKKCDFNATNSRIYLEHLNEYHGEKLKIHHCQHCNYSSQYKPTLKRHMSKKHVEMTDNYVASQETINNYIGIPNNNLITNNNNNNIKTSYIGNGSLLRKKFSCTYCERFSTSDINSIRHHIHKHLYKKGDDNNYCSSNEIWRESHENESSLSPKKRRSQMEFSTTNKKFCPIAREAEFGTVLRKKRRKSCNTEIGKKINKKQKRRHSIQFGSKEATTVQIHCMYCEYSTANWSNFLCHKNNHQPGRGQYKCIECSFNNPKQYVVKRHYNTYHKSKGIQLGPDSSVYIVNDHEGEPKVKETLKDLNEKNPHEEETPATQEESNDDFSSNFELQTQFSESEGDKKDGVQSVNSIRRDFFRCKLCYKVKFGCLSNALNHVRTKHNNNKNLITKHVDSSPNKQNLNCMECPFIARTAVQLSKHKELHKKIPGYIKCRYCSYNVKVKYALYVHEQLHTTSDTEHDDDLAEDHETDTYEESKISHEKLDEDDKEVYCQQLSGRLRAKGRTVGKMTKIEKQYCPNCPFATIDAEAFEQHMLRHENDLASQFECGDCSYIGKSRQDLSKHSKLHERELGATNTEYACEKCPYATRNQERIARHCSLHGATSLRYGCQFCSYFSISYQFLKEHSILHSKPSDHLVYTHSLEALKNAAKRTMIYHKDDKIIHDDLMLYEHSAIYSRPTTGVSQACTFCPYIAIDSTDLVDHQKGHSSDVNSPFKCYDCNFGATTRSSFLKHVLCHSICDVDHLYDLLMQQEISGISKPIPPYKAYQMGKAAMTLAENHSMEDWIVAMKKCY